MPSRPERPLLPRRFLMVSAAVLLAVGFGLTLLIFYPGVMTYDAKFVYEDIAKGTYGDWQSPVMVWLWGLIDPIAPGAASMFLLTAATYWLGFGVLSLVLASRGKAGALLLPLLAMTPPALALAGIIWRDVLFATCWLLAAAVAFAASEQSITGQIDRAGTGACTGYPWDAVETERLARRADPRGLYRLVIAGLPAQDGDLLHPGRDRLVRHRATGLLRHAGRETTAPAANDHDFRSGRHQPFRKRTSFRSTGANRKTQCCSIAATSRRCGISIGGSSHVTS